MDASESYSDWARRQVDEIQQKQSKLVDEYTTKLGKIATLPTEEEMLQAEAALRAKYDRKLDMLAGSAKAVRAYEERHIPKPEPPLPPALRYGVIPPLRAGAGPGPTPTGMIATSVYNPQYMGLPTPQSGGYLSGPLPVVPSYAGPGPGGYPSEPPPLVPVEPYPAPALPRGGYPSLVPTPHLPRQELARFPLPNPPPNPTPRPMPHHHFEPWPKDPRPQYTSHIPIPPAPPKPPLHVHFGGAQPHAAVVPWAPPQPHLPVALSTSRPQYNGELLSHRDRNSHPYKLLNAPMTISHFPEWACELHAMAEWEHAMRVAEVEREFAIRSIDHGLSPEDRRQEEARTFERLMSMHEEHVARFFGELRREYELRTGLRFVQFGLREKLLKTISDYHFSQYAHDARMIAGPQPVLWP